MRMVPTGHQNGAVDLTIWVDAWQMQCCGERFAVGDEVSWRLREAGSDWLENVLGAEVARGVDAAEEHHGGVGEDTAVTVGAVVSIELTDVRIRPPD
jgi:hypothetical protein